MGMKTKLIPDFFDDTVTNETKTSEACNIESAYGISVRVGYSGASLAGTIKLEASLDSENWEEVSGTSTAVSAAGGSVFYNISDIFYPFVRLSIQSSNANTITATAKIYTKGL